MYGKGCGLWLVVGFWSLETRATGSVPPMPSAPYARLAFPASVRLPTFDNQAVDLVPSARHC
jgi:hypothetical protein